jgi:hypothetical protein
LARFKAQVGSEHLQRLDELCYQELLEPEVSQVAFADSLAVFVDLLLRAQEILNKAV